MTAGEPYVSFLVPGEPQGKGRPKIITIAGHGAMAAPPKAVAYEGLIAMAASAAMAGRIPIEEPVAVLVVAGFSVPASWSGSKRAAALAGYMHVTKKPDADNILKSVGDAGNKVLWADDSQIAAAMVRKVYTANPGVRVSVHVLGQRTKLRDAPWVLDAPAYLLESAG